MFYSKKIVRHTVKKNLSKLHRIGPYNICKIALSCFDDQRYILDDGINGSAYFYKDIKSQKNWVKLIEFH